jgi:hypothetical protein
MIPARRHQGRLFTSEGSLVDLAISDGFEVNEGAISGSPSTLLMGE